MQAHFTAKGKGMLEVKLRYIANGRSLTVFGAHLSSGSTPEDEGKRLAEEVDSPEGLAALVQARCQEAAAEAASASSGSAGRTAVVVAMDANAHPQLRAQDGESSVWRSLREAAGASVWDAHFDASGDEVALEGGSKLEAPVTSNKLRGPVSDQPKKIGEHAYFCIDHVFFDPASLKLQGHVVPPQQFASQTAALTEVQPSLRNPSDHYPVVVDLAWVR